MTANLFIDNNKTKNNRNAYINVGVTQITYTTAMAPYH